MAVTRRSGRVNRDALSVNSATLPIRWLSGVGVDSFIRGCAGHRVQVDLATFERRKRERLCAHARATARIDLRGSTEELRQYGTDSWPDLVLVERRSPRGGWIFSGGLTLVLEDRMIVLSGSAVSEECRRWRVAESDRVVQRPDTGRKIAALRSAMAYGDTAAVEKAVEPLLDDLSRIDRDQWMAEMVRVLNVVRNEAFSLRQAVWTLQAFAERVAHGARLRPITRRPGGSDEPLHSPVDVGQGSATTLVLRALAEGPMRARDIVQATGLEPASVNSALSRLVRTQRAERVPELEAAQHSGRKARWYASREVRP